MSVQMARRLTLKGKTLIAAVDQQNNTADIIKSKNYKIDYIKTNRTSVSEMVEQVIGSTRLKNYREYAPLIAPDFITMATLAESMYDLRDKVDNVVIDFPPNHSAFVMLILPDIMEKMSFKILTIKHRIKRLITGKDITLDNIDYFHKILKSFKSDMSNARYCCLGIPSELGLIETKRLVEFLKNQNMKPHRIILNMYENGETRNCSVCNENSKLSGKMLLKYSKLAEKEHIPFFVIPRTPDDDLIMGYLLRAEVTKND